MYFNIFCLIHPHICDNYHQMVGFFILYKILIFTILFFNYNYSFQLYKIAFFTIHVFIKLNQF